MTAEQMRSISQIPWRRIGEFPGVPVSSLRNDALIAQNVDQFGLRFASAVAHFDGKGRLSSIALIYHLGAPTIDDCKGRFEGLLRKMETQYGVFEPGDDDWGPAVALSKTDVTRQLSGARSQYRDVVRGNFQDPASNLDGRVFHASAKKVYGERSIAVGMGITEHFEQPENLKVPENILALAPHLADPKCLLNVNFGSTSVVLSDFPVMKPVAPEQSQSPPSAINHGPLPSEIASRVQAFLDTAKKDGLMGPIDPLLDAYMRARAASDDTDVQALLEKIDSGAKGRSGLYTP